LHLQHPKGTVYTGLNSIIGVGLINMSGRKREIHWESAVRESLVKRHVIRELVRYEVERVEVWERVVMSE